MVNRWAKAIVKGLIANGTIEEEKAALYEFGFEQGFRTIAETLLLLVTGLVLRAFWQCVFILFIFTPIRRYAGGYHAKTEKMCYILSYLSLALSLFLLFNLTCLLWKAPRRCCFLLWHRTERARRL